MKVLAVIVITGKCIINFSKAKKTVLYFASFHLFMEQGKREILQKNLTKKCDIPSPVSAGIYILHFSHKQRSHKTS